MEETEKYIIFSIINYTYFNKNNYETIMMIIS
jgi:hypothetical protein